MEENPGWAGAHGRGGRVSGPGEKLCDLAEIEDPGSAGFTIELDGKKKMIMVIHRKGEAYAYVNSCPHIGAPLDFKPGQFLSSDKKLIMCSTHGALFQIIDGLCIFGPCQKASLKSVPIDVVDGEVRLA